MANITLTSDTKQKKLQTPHHGYLEAASLLKMITKDELSQNLTITKNTLPKRASTDHSNTSKMNDAKTCICPYSSLFEIKPIWAFATNPLFWSCHGTKDPTLELETPKRAVLHKIKGTGKHLKTTSSFLALPPELFWVSFCMLGTNCAEHLPPCWGSSLWPPPCVERTQKLLSAQDRYAAPALSKVRVTNHDWF